LISIGTLVYNFNKIFLKLTFVPASLGAKLKVYMKSYIVDSFTNKPFKGNPAGVCFPKDELSGERMQNIALEFGLSETAFVRGINKAVYAIRYFSPKQEIPLCGHATLAAAKIIFRNTDENEIHFITSENLDLLIKKQDEEIIMELPLHEIIYTTVPPALLEALGLVKVINTALSSKNKIILLEINDDNLLAQLKPDFAALLNSFKGINGVLVTAPSGSEDYDFHYRYFWPWAGTNEDPVTGGVQTFLAKYWADKLGKKKMKAFQSSGRTGYMTVELQGEKILVTGEAIIIFDGSLLL
jgi:PhzF family phenazine biosynthesis protein